MTRLTKAQTDSIRVMLEANDVPATSSNIRRVFDLFGPMRLFTAMDDEAIFSQIGLRDDCEQDVQLEHSDEVLSNVHRAGDCHGDHCPIHRRSDHSMRSFPQHWRSDRGLMERICPHGIGHPDPDAMLNDADGVHGCDGCCAPIVAP